jgi:thiamine-phosphate pyrophosphorylase
LIEPLYVILDFDTAQRAGWTIPDLAAACLQGGARLLQLRAKRAPSAWLLDVAERVIALARETDAHVIVNDRVDIAKLSGAYGVHVGQDDLPPSAVRAIAGPAAVIGLSTHTPEQLAAALTEPANYLAIGPVFDTGTKATGYKAVGLEAVRSAARVAHDHGLPLVAIGGMTLDRMDDVFAAGATSVAVISDMLVTGDPASRVREYLHRLAR